MSGKREMEKRPSRKKSSKGFARKVLLFTIIQIVIYEIWQMVVFTISGNEASSLTQWMFTFWGIEVALCMMKKLADGKRQSQDSEEG